jgi:hypothetical protein
MDPISIGLGLAGLGMQIFGGLGAASVAKQSAQVSADVSGQEQAINVQKYQQMQLDANRSQLQNTRKVQLARAQGLATATGQSAQFGSGLAGGQAAASDQGGVNALGINQNLSIGQNIFSDTSSINADKMKLAELGGTAATDQGIASLGGAVMKAGPVIGGFAKNIGASGNSFFGGGSPSGYG